MKIIINRLIQLDRRYKQMLMLMFDLCILPISIWIAIGLRFGSLFPKEEIFTHSLIFGLLVFITIPFFIRNGLYRAVLKYMGSQVIFASIRAITMACIVTITCIYIFSIFQPIPRSIILIFWFVSILFTVGSRYLMKLFIYPPEQFKVPVAIYGSGKMAAQLIDKLQSGSEYLPSAIFDNNSAMWGTVINSIWVYPPEKINQIIKDKKIKLLLLAIENLSANQKKKILNQIANFPIEIRVISSLEKLSSSELNINTVKKVEVEDILGRKIVKPSKRLMEKNIRNKSILVTGAGGSIGSELCKQIIKFNPKIVVLFDHSEFALYEINQSIEKKNLDISIFPVLGSVTDYNLFYNVIKKYKINTVYHAAAYKHVPMVELNPIEGVINNILGTFNCVKASMQYGVDRFILISTDKAVRPTNIMGATKRCSELILQGAQLTGTKTCFSMVRFGNVIDSAGSVVPLFRKQIKAHGPVTVTHPDITRYFMSIEEAVELVIQAGAMSQGGDVFVLEMGEPIKIIELAKKMIYLSGFTPAFGDNPNGDIEIKVTGLRPGEKLFEELLIGENVYSTDHPNIMQAKEKSIKWNEINMMINNIENLCKDFNIKGVISILKNSIDGYKPADLDYNSIDGKIKLDSLADKLDANIKGIS